MSKVEAVLEKTGPYERFTTESVTKWNGTPLRDEDGNVIGEMTEVWVEDDGRTIKGRFALVRTQPRRKGPSETSRG